MKKFVFLVVVVLLTTVALAQYHPYGYYTQTMSYTTSIQPPIDANNSSTFTAKRGVVPVKFTLSVGTGDLRIVSTTDGFADHAFGGVTFDLPASPFPLTLNNMANLRANGTQIGCAAGSPRFTLDFGGGQIMFVYFGGADPAHYGDPNYDCNAGMNTNLLSDPGATRFEAKNMGDSVLYDNITHIKELYGDMPIVGIWLVTDNGNSEVTLSSVEIAGATYTFASDATPTCDLPPATISVIEAGGSSLVGVDEPVITAPPDNGGNFRIDDCQYIYNLSIKGWDTGIYKVFASIDGKLIENPGQFSTK